MTLYAWIKSLFAKPLKEIGGLTRFLSWRPKNRHPQEPSELERARLVRDAAAARYRDACRRNDTREQHVYLDQFMKATSRVLKVEMGVGA